MFPLLCFLIMLFTYVSMRGYVFFLITYVMLFLRFYAGLSIFLN